jgi:hypothetical protein
MLLAYIALQTESPNETKYKESPIDSWLHGAAPCRMTPIAFDYL